MSLSFRDSTAHNIHNRYIFTVAADVLVALHGKVQSVPKKSVDYEATGTGITKPFTRESIDLSV